jgi:hypothetical protein
MHLNGYNIWYEFTDLFNSERLLSIPRFFDDIELLRRKWQSSNVENVAEL